jgi:hypothetical protein
MFTDVQRYSPQKAHRCTQSAMAAMAWKRISRATPVFDPVSESVMRIMIVTLMALLLSGCLVRTAASVVTAPFKVVGQAADWATTSQDEADRNSGRELRREEERRGREYRECLDDYEREYCDEVYASPNGSDDEER